MLSIRAFYIHLKKTGQLFVSYFLIESLSRIVSLAFSLWVITFKT